MEGLEWTWKRYCFEEQEHIAKITLNNPERKNAFDLETRLELMEVFEKIRDDNAVKAIIMTGAGDAFSSGGDIATMGCWNSFATATLGIIFLSAGFEGYCFVLARISIPVRAIFIGSGFLIFHPSNVTDLIGLGLVGVAIVLHYVLRAVGGKRADAIQETRLFPDQEK